MTTTLTNEDIKELFMGQKGDSPFRALAVCTAGLHYLNRLQRLFRDQQNPPAERQQACRQWLKLEPRLYQYLHQQTPLSLFDAGYQDEVKDYVRLRLIWLDSRDCTFARHRLTLLLELLHLCRNDFCQTLPGREVLADELEKHLLHSYLLYDMNLKNTQFVGREAVSNGYHECDFTLEIEDILKEPHQAVPRCQFRYVQQSLPESRMAACTAAWLYEHRQDLRRNRWIVDEKAIEAQYQNRNIPAVTQDMLAELTKVYGGNASA